MDKKVLKTDSLSSFDLMNYYIKYLLDSELTICTIKSRPGLGKTFTTTQTLKQRGMKLGTDYLYLIGYITPLDLFEKLQEHPKGLVVLDDLDALLADKKNTALLKSATYPTLEDIRMVQYQSTKRDQEKSAFICNTKFILLCNSIPKGLDFQAIQNRGIFYDLKPTNNEVFLEIMKNPKCDVELIEFMKDQLKQHNPADFRKYKLISGLKQAFPDQWQRLAEPILRTNDAYSFIRDLLDSGLRVEKQIEKYKTQGKSRSTYFRHKQKVLDE